MNEHSTRRVGPPRCQYGLIDIDFSTCSEPSRATESGLLICTKHMRYIARRAGYVPRSRLDVEAQREKDMEYRSLEAKVAQLERQLKSAEDFREQQQRERSRGGEKDGVVYFLRSNGFVKIGWTSDLDSRLKQYDPDARVLATKPGTRADERFLHKKFDHLRTHRREWFAMAPQVMEEIQRTVREHGEPPRDINEPVSVHRIVGPRLDNYIGGRSKSA